MSILIGFAFVFGAMGIAFFLEGEFRAGIPGLVLSALCVAPCILMWKDDREYKEKMNFEHGGEGFRKKWIAKRRIVRAICALILMAMGFVLVMNIGELQQYYIDLSLAAESNNDIWTTVNVTTSREVVDWKGSVGGDLELNCYINGKSTDNGQIEVRLFSGNVIKSVLTESDPSNDDRGIKTNVLYLTPRQLSEGTTFAHKVTVRERSGRYAGSYLTMQVTYTIQAETPIDISALHKYDKFFLILQGNPIGLIIFYLLLTALCVYYLYAWKRDKILLVSKVEAIEKEEKACAWKREQERQRLIKEKEEKARRQEEQKRLQMLREEEAQKDKEDAIADEALEYAIKKREAEDIEDAIAEAAYYYAINKERVRQQLQGKTVEEAAGVPRKVRFTEDLLPYDEGYPGKYGHYSVYMTPYASCYHAKRGCHGAQEEVHIFEALKKYKPPCLICARQYPYNIPQWYERYKILLKEKEYYNL